MPDRFADYAKRDEILRSMGYSSYGEYLKSDRWRHIRQRVFAMYGTSCVKCGDKATQVHHDLYTRKVLLGRSMTHLFPVCRQCHERGELKDGVKVTLEIANRHIVPQPDFSVPIKERQARGITNPYARSACKKPKKPRKVRRPCPRCGVVEIAQNVQCCIRCARSRIVSH